MPDPLNTQEFIKRIDEIVSRNEPKEQTVAAIQSMVTRALETPGWLPERCQRPTPGCYARHLLHQDSRGRFTVVAMVWQSGQKTPIHDHGGVWCVEGVYEGRIRVNRYDLDSPVDEAIARFHSFDILEAGIGQTGALIPPVDYHVIENPFETKAITVHTYGGEMKTCHAYIPRSDGSFDILTKELSYTTVPAQTVPSASVRG